MLERVRQNQIRTTTRLVSYDDQGPTFEWIRTDSKVKFLVGVPLKDSVRRTLRFIGTNCRRTAITIACFFHFKIAGSYMRISCRSLSVLHTVLTKGFVLSSDKETSLDLEFAQAFSIPIRPGIKAKTPRTAQRATGTRGTDKGRSSTRDPELYRIFRRIVDHHLPRPNNLGVDNIKVRHRAGRDVYVRRAAAHLLVNETHTYKDLPRNVFPLVGILHRREKCRSDGTMRQVHPMSIEYEIYLRTLFKDASYASDDKYSDLWPDYKFSYDIKRCDEQLTPYIDKISKTRFNFKLLPLLANRNYLKKVHKYPSGSYGTSHLVNWFANALGVSLGIPFKVFGDALVFKQKVKHPLLQRNPDYQVSGFSYQNNNIRLVNNTIIKNRIQSCFTSPIARYVVTYYCYKILGSDVKNQVFATGKNNLHHTLFKHEDFLEYLKTAIKKTSKKLDPLFQKCQFYATFPQNLAIVLNKYSSSEGQLMDPFHSPKLL